MGRKELIDKIITIIITYLFKPSYDEENMIDVIGDECIYYGLKYYGLDKNDYLFEDSIKKDNLTYYLLWDKNNKKYELYWVDYGRCIVLRHKLMHLSRISDTAVFIDSILKREMKDVLIQGLYQYILDKHIFAIKTESNLLCKFKYDFNLRLLSFYDLKRQVLVESHSNRAIIHWLYLICMSPIATKEDIMNEIHQIKLSYYSMLNEKLSKLRKFVIEINKS